MIKLYRDMSLSHIAQAYHEYMTLRHDKALEGDSVHLNHALLCLDKEEIVQQF